MKRNRLIIGIGFASVLIFALASQCLLVVDAATFVIVTEFGRPVRVYNFERDDAGLHVKAPWQVARAVDRRLQMSEPAGRELITGDKRNLDCAVFILWRVVDPLQFVRSAGTLEVASARLEERVASALGTVLSRQDLASLATTDRRTWALERVCGDTAALAAKNARDELGLELVDVGLERFAYPLEVRPAVFDLIRSERQQVAQSLKAEGDAAYRVTLAEAKARRDERLANAEAEAAKLRAQGEADAARLLDSAHAQDPEFYAFLQTLEAYRALLDDRTTLVLSASSPLLKLLRDGPARPADAKPSSASAGGCEEHSKP